jgi:hypothetical protein
MLISMPSCIKNTVAIFAPSGNTFAMLVKGVHVDDPKVTIQNSRNKYYVSSADNNYRMNRLVSKRRLL